MYKITDHPFAIQFIPKTTIDGFMDNALVINLQKFILKKFDHLQALASTNLELFTVHHMADVVGKIGCVQGSDLKDAEVMTRLLVCFVVEP
ncbi:unnamed protein product [Eruca vesicaria subsp. sativa]|uniref:Uncharacterized protein n=1 Tax=Eruca vesicaria subsp. sativa TaxID=29727 RepID=A0ABC8IRK6_ERUVS|nr:unnamed protein product [Eruca vesicaria subsp. sativa]